VRLSAPDDKRVQVRRAGRALRQIAKLQEVQVDVSNGELHTIASGEGVERDGERVVVQAAEALGVFQ